MLHNFMTRKVRDSLIKRLEEIRVQRLRLANELEVAAGFGDLRENAEYDAAMEQQGRLNREAENIRKRLSNATLIEDLNITGEKASIGTAVTVCNHEERRVYVIVGCPDDESPIPGVKVTFNSPVARYLLGKVEGDIVYLGFNGFKEEVEIVSIEKVFV